MLQPISLNVLPYKPKQNKPTVKKRGRSIDDIPIELLSSIFLFVCNQNVYDHYPQLRLSAVSRRWRSTCLSTRSLWTTVLLPIPSHQPRQLARMAFWLARSGSHPIDLVLDFRDPEWSFDSDCLHPFGWKQMHSVLEILLPHFDRCKSVELWTDTWAPIWTFLICLEGRRGERLEKISMGRCNAYYASRGQRFQPIELRQPIKLFGGAALKDIILAGVHVDWSSFSFYGLEKLELKYHASDVMPTVDEFISMLTNSPHLEHLSLIGPGPQFVPIKPMLERNRNQKSICLPKLKTFTFGFVDVECALETFGLFDFAGIEEFGIEDVQNGLHRTEEEDSSAVFDLLSGSESGIKLGNVKTVKLTSVRARVGAVTRFLGKCAGLKRLVLDDVDCGLVDGLKEQVQCAEFVA